MIQKHTMVFYKEAFNTAVDFEEIVHQTFELFCVFRKLDIDWQPNYLTGKSKKEAQKIRWDLDFFLEQLSKGVNRERNSTFPRLGYTISFFSSLVEEKSFSYRLTIGVQDDRFYNSLTIGIPTSVDVFTGDTAHKIYDIFADIVSVFKPYYGCVYNAILLKNVGAILDRKKPTMVHWINYWSSILIDRMGNGAQRNLIRLQNKEDNFQAEGIIFKIKDTAIDVKNNVEVDFFERHQEQFLRG